MSALQASPWLSTPKVFSLHFTAFIHRHSVHSGLANHSLFFPFPSTVIIMSVCMLYTHVKKYIRTYTFMHKCTHACIHAYISAYVLKYMIGCNMAYIIL